MESRPGLLEQASRLELSRASSLFLRFGDAGYAVVATISGLKRSVYVVGERSVSLRRWLERAAGGIRSANADMSSVKGGEKPPRRKPKVSCSKFIGAG
jgi:hypothetical protein